MFLKVGVLNRKKATPREIYSHRETRSRDVLKNYGGREEHPYSTLSSSEPPIFHDNYFRNCNKHPGMS